MKFTKKELIILFASLPIGIFVGYILGLYNAYQIGLDLANRFLDISINAEGFKDLIAHYPSIKLLNISA